MTKKKVSHWFWILVLSASCREMQARGSIIFEHETVLLTSEREALRNEHLYEHIVDIRSHDPIRFDLHNPILGDMLTEQSSFEDWLNRWEAHPARFEHWHPRFWRIIDGEALAGGPPIIDPPIFPTDQGGDPGGSHDLRGGPSGQPGQPGLAHPAAVVPEPSSLRLVLVAIGLILVVRGGWIKGCLAALG